MKSWEILKEENIGKRYKTKIYGRETVLKIGYDRNLNKFLTLKKGEKDGVDFPLDSLFLDCILQMDFKSL